MQDPLPTNGTDSTPNAPPQPTPIAPTAVPSPTPAVSPVPIYQPALPTQPMSPTTPLASPPPLATPPTPPKKKTGLIIGIVLGSVGFLALAGAVLFYLLLWPGMQVTSTANSFVSATAKGDYDQALKLADSEEDEAGARTLVERLDSQLGEKKYELDSVTTKGSTQRVKYVLSEDKDKSFIIGLDKVDGSWKVVEIVISLGESTAAVDTPKGTSEASRCLPQASIDKFWRYKSGWEFYFEADSNQVVYENVAAEYIVNMKEFYADNTQYDFTFVIDVSLYQADGTNASAQELALLRASIVAYNMNLKGIPYDVIRFGKVIYNNGDATTPQYAAGYRSSYVTINKACDARSQDQNLKQGIDSKYGF